MLNLFIALVSILLTSPAIAQQIPDSTNTSSDSPAKNWSYSAFFYYYIIPDHKDLTSFIGYVDYKAWHLEARYNYEDSNTASIFAGYRFEFGKKLVLGLRPLIGGIFGNTNGIAPGLELDLTWKKFDFYSETEYVFDLEGKGNDYLYIWSELGITPFTNFRTGVSASRTKYYETGFDFQRGIFAQYSFWQLTTGIHYFNPFSDYYYLIATLEIVF